MQKNEGGPLPYTIKKHLNSKCSKNLNIRPKIFLRRKQEKNLHNIGFSNDFLDRTPKTKAINVKINFIKRYFYSLFFKPESHVAR